MRKILTIITVLITLVWGMMFGSEPIFAHLPGQPPFFKINGVYSQLYFVPTTSLSDFPLPQDGAPANYLVNQPIHFELDINRLPPAPPGALEKTKFLWDFGDGVSGTGLTNTHSYSKIGSYLLSIHIDDGSAPTPQLLESVMLNILPNSNYQLPKAVIEVDGKQGQGMPTPLLAAQFGQSLHLDASHSSGKIVSYFWDFGDQKSSTQVAEDHFYPGDLTQVFPVLRIQDSNGFISDTFVELTSQAQAVRAANPLTKPSQVGSAVKVSPHSSSQLPIIIGIIVALGVIYLFMRLVKRPKR